MVIKREKLSLRECRLCRKERELKNSHIISEFMFTPLYDDKHRITALSTDDQVPNRLIQKGIREYLFCDKCEQLFSVWECYFADTIPQAKKSQYSGAIVITGLQYNQVKLFQLSILFRAAVATCNECYGVSLAPKHIQKLRSILLESNPGECLDYPCMIIIPEVCTKIGDGLIVMPDMIRSGGNNIVRFIINSLFWCYFVSSHTNTIPAPEFFLRKTGELPLIFDKGLSTPYLHKLAAELKRGGKLKGK